MNNIYAIGLRNPEPGETRDEAFLFFVNQIKNMPCSVSVRQQMMTKLVEAYFEVSTDDYH